MFPMASYERFSPALSLPTGKEMVDIIDSRVRQGGGTWRATVVDVDSSGWVRVRRPGQSEPEAKYCPVVGGDTPDIGEDVLMLSGQAGDSYCLGSVVDSTRRTGSLFAVAEIGDNPRPGTDLGTTIYGSTEPNDNGGVEYVVGAPTTGGAEVAIYPGVLASVPCVGDIVRAARDSEGVWRMTGITEPIVSPVMVMNCGNANNMYYNTGWQTVKELDVPVGVWWVDVSGHWGWSKYDSSPTVSTYGGILRLGVAGDAGTNHTGFGLGVILDISRVAIVGLSRTQALGFRHEAVLRVYDRSDIEGWTGGRIRCEAAHYYPAPSWSSSYADANDTIDWSGQWITVRRAPWPTYAPEPIPS